MRFLHIPPHPSSEDGQHVFYRFVSGLVAYQIESLSQLREPAYWQYLVAVRLDTDMSTLDVLARKGYLTTYIMQAQRHARYYALAVEEEQVRAAIALRDMGFTRDIAPLAHVLVEPTPPLPLSSSPRLRLPQRGLAEPKLLLSVLRKDFPMLPYKRRSSSFETLVPLGGRVVAASYSSQGGGSLTFAELTETEADRLLSLLTEAAETAAGKASYVAPRVRDRVVAEPDDTRPEGMVAAQPLAAAPQPPPAQSAEPPPPLPEPELPVSQPTAATPEPPPVTTAAPPATFTSAHEQSPAKRGRKPKVPKEPAEVSPSLPAQAAQDGPLASAPEDRAAVELEVKVVDDIPFGTPSSPDTTETRFDPAAFGQEDGTEADPWGLHAKYGDGPKPAPSVSSPTHASPAPPTPLASPPAAQPPVAASTPKPTNGSNGASSAAMVTHTPSSGPYARIAGGVGITEADLNSFKGTANLRPLICYFFDKGIRTRDKMMEAFRALADVPLLSRMTPSALEERLLIIALTFDGWPQDDLPPPA